MSENWERLEREYEYRKFHDSQEDKELEEYEEEYDPEIHGEL